jgi:hypothetical protein
LKAAYQVGGHGHPGQEAGKEVVVVVLLMMMMWRT